MAAYSKLENLLMSVDDVCQFLPDYKTEFGQRVPNWWFLCQWSHSLGGLELVELEPTTNTGEEQEEQGLWIMIKAFL